MTRGEGSAARSFGPSVVQVGWRLALWLALLGLLAAWLATTLRLSGDLRLFMPAARDAAQRLLLEQLGEGPGSRLQLIALHGEEADVVVARGRALRDRLREDERFVWSSNGEEGLDEIPERLRDYRYLLSPGVEQGAFTVDALRVALQDRLDDLASPAAALVAPLMAEDPTLESLRLLESWGPSREPERWGGAWLSPEGEALLVAETRAPGFDPAGQQAAQQALRDAYAEALAEEGAEGTAGVDHPLDIDAARQRGLEVSGPGAFAERMATQTRDEATRFGRWAVLALIVLLTLGYRSVVPPLLGALPLASAALGGLALTALVFGSVHGITLAFGLTLIGVAQDYPIHLFSHRRSDESAVATARAIWPTLALGAFSSAMAYLVFFFTGVEGLRQLAVLTVSGLVIAALCTRFVLPHVLPARLPAPRLWGHAATALAAASASRGKRVLGGLVLAVGTVLCVAPATPWWEDNLAALTPLPHDLLQRDRALRKALAAPDVRWLLVLRADSVEQALQRSEALQGELDALVERGGLGGYEFAARYLPSQARQRARQAQLPTRIELAPSLQQAQQGLPFRADAFAPFLDAVSRARSLPPLQLADLDDTALALRLGGLLLDEKAAPDAAAPGRSAGTAALIQLSGVDDVAPLHELAHRHADLDVLDLKQVAGSLASAWRGHLLRAMAAAALLLALLVTLSLRSLRRSARVLWPVALGSLLVVGILHAAGQTFTLFHLVAMVLAAGLGLDYALFFERAARQPAEYRRTLHSLVLCALSTLLVFGLLALSGIPVLHALGSTVALGVAAHFTLSLALAGGGVEHAQPAPHEDAHG